MKKDKALRWPYGIAASFILIILLIYWTIAESLKYPVEESDINMQRYHVLDKHANDFIVAKISFDKKYNLKYIGEQLSSDAAVVRFSVSDKNGTPINNAKVEALLTRPDTHQFDIKLEEPSVADGIYTFASVKLPKEGRWNIIAKVSVGDESRYINLKADTRDSSVFEY